MSQLPSPWIDRISLIDPAEWDALLVPGDNPCLAHAFLLALEQSGSAAASTGWHARIYARRQDGRLVAAAPLWLKENSDGEYLYDHAFAQAAAQVGRSWYPKLVGMIPATPTAAFRLLCAPGTDHGALASRFFADLDELAACEDVSHTVLNFLDPVWAESLEGTGGDGPEWQTWFGQSWRMDLRGAGDFEGYLAGFGKNQRRNIRRELDSVQAQGFRLEMVDGEDAPDSWFTLMARLYHQTNDLWGPWAARWVNTDFYTRLAASPEGRKLCTFSCAFRGSGGEPLAMAFLLKGRDWLVGRYWGSDTDAPDLHFAVCYYLPIRYALEHGIGWFDPGAGSEHKVRRGFEAWPHQARFKFRDQELDRLFRYNIPRFNQELVQWVGALNAQSPLRGCAR